MTDAIVTPPDTPLSNQTPTPDAAPAGDGTVLGGAQEANPASPAADPAQTDPNAPADPAAPVLPEKYEFTVEGFTPDPDILTAADPVLRELNLTNEQANKLAPLAQSIVEKTTASLVQQLQAGAAVQKKAWLDAFTADPEIGGTNKAQTEVLAAKALDALGYTKGHPFRQALNDSGFGNHPDMIRAFRRLGEMVGEDNSFARAGVGHADKPVWERMYPNG
jgi:hypothetical protein